MIFCFAFQALSVMKVHHKRFKQRRDAWDGLELCFTAWLGRSSNIGVIGSLGLLLSRTLVVLVPCIYFQMLRLWGASLSPNWYGLDVRIHTFCL